MGLSGLVLSIAMLTEGCSGSPYAADSGFRPAKDGFSFANYGSDAGPAELTAARLVELFGNKVCASQTGGTCQLTPPAERWRQQMNMLLGFGHCEGMAVLSTFLFAKQSGLTPAQFGAATIPELQITNNVALQTEIAKWASTQVLLPTRFGEYGSQNTPKEVLEKLRQMWSAGKYPTLLLRRLDILDGHSFVPYQIIDKGNNSVGLMVYDPDYPKQEREVTIDLNTESWSYLFATLPSGEPYKYEGNASTFNLHILDPSNRQGPQDCSFCEGPAGSNQTASVTSASTITAVPNATLHNTNPFQGDVKLLMVNTDSSYTSYQGALGTTGNEVGKSYKPIPVDMTTMFPRLLNHPSPPPLFNLPSAYDSTLTLTGDQRLQGKPASFSLSGPGYDLYVGNILLAPGQQDTIVIPKGQGQITYTTTADETPQVTVGFESPNADFELSLVADGAPTGISISLKKDETKGEFSFQVKGAPNYALQMVRIDTAGEQVFSHAGTAISANDTIIIQYGSWLGQGSPLTLQIDSGSNGTIDQTIQVSDDDLPRM